VALSMSIVAVVFGWPAVIVSILLTLAGIAVSRSRLVLGGALVGSPFLFYLLLTPRFGWVVPPVALSYFGAALAVARGHRVTAFACVAPFLALAVVVAELVLRQYAG
jgi:hypothetical protein